MVVTGNNGIANSQIPPISHNAVFKPSDPIPEGIPTVSGIEFNKFQNNNVDITAAELVSSMTNSGFQASAVAEAARIINDMVIYNLFVITSISNRLP